MDGGVVAQMRKNLEELRNRGVEPYPPRAERTALAGDLTENYDEREGSRVTIAGRLMAVRGHGKAGFADLLDGSGKIQLYVRKDDVGDEQFELWKLLDVGDIVGATGEVFRTRSGEVSLKAETVTLLAKALRPLPEKWHGLKDKEVRYRQRYLDLIANEESRETFRIRSRMLQFMRQFLNERDFLEVETPVLQPIYGGGFAEPFATRHNALDATLYLRIADELYLKRLIVGGFERVFEIGKDFRNEGIDRTHSPEFTQLELYQAYTDYHGMMEIMESMTVGMARELLGGTTMAWQDAEIDLEPPWKRLSVLDAVAGALGAEALESVEALASAVSGAGLDVSEPLDQAALIESVLDELVEPTLREPTFLIDYPKALSPLAKEKPGAPGIVERFEVFIGGVELGNSFSELNDPDEQRERFEAQQEKREGGDAEAHGMDEDFVRALEHGMPPTGGLGIGVDRLVMLFTNNWNIRDVILFPAMRREPGDS